MFGSYNRNITNVRSKYPNRGILMRTRRTIRRHLRNFTVILLMILAFCSGFFGHTLLNARAEEKARPEWNRYYTSVQIRQGRQSLEPGRQIPPRSGYSVRST